MNWNIFNILILLGCIHGILFSSFLLSNTQFKKKSNLYLVGFLLSFTINNLIYVVFDIGYESKNYLIRVFSQFNWALLMPFMFLGFLNYLLEPTYKARLAFYVLLLPFGFNVSFELMYITLYTFNFGLIQPYAGFFNGLTIFWELFAILFAVVVIIHIFIKIRKYQKQLLHHFSNLENRSVQWLYKLIFAMICLWLLWMIPYIYEVVSGNFQQHHHYPLWIGMSIIVYWIGYSAYIRKDIFQSVKVGEVKSNEDALSNNVDKYHKALLASMEKEKLYLNTDLNLSVLANTLEISSGYLSQIINQKEGKSFYDFINSYRVEEVKHLIENPSFSHYSLLAIGLEAGFNSKSTFNATFKKQVGMTPSQYKKKSESFKS